jgi:hypothetical protein
MHSTDDLEDGYVGSGKHLWYSIRKHGKENHATEILEYLPSRKEVSLRENELVNVELLNDPLCMNLVVGGPSGGWKLTTEQRTEFSKKAGEAYAKRIKEDLVFRKECSEKRSLIEKTKDPKHLEAKRKKSVEKWTGCKHSDEAKKKMSASHSGENNSQSGSCWIYNVDLKENKKIRKEELELFISDGWIKGRKYFEE